MRIVSYNVENFFDRAKALNLATWKDGAPILAAYSQLNALLEKDTYSAADKKNILALLGILGLVKSDNAPMAILRQNRGRLVTRHRDGTVDIVADGRGAWIGWVELTTEPVLERAIENTARVIGDLNPDVLGVVEAENRIVLKQFTDAALRDGSDVRYPHVMLIDGNDDRGIDVAILTKKDWPLGLMQSHVDDTDGNGVIFSRDCPEFNVRTPDSHRLVLLLNHLKSKGYGSQADNNARRQRQAARVAEIYRALIDDGYVYVAILGDLNDTPGSAPLAPLVQATDLADISTHPGFDNGGREGTFGNCPPSEHIDYILLSPSLFAKATGGGIYRMGAWGGVNGTLWEHYDTLTKATEAASDHCAVFADISLT